MKKLLLGLALLIPATLLAQNIKGTVYLQGENSPAQFAGVSLLRPADSVPVTGVITLSDGGYTFEKVNPGDYLVKVSFLGYNAAYRNASLKQGVKETLVDTIFLTAKSSDLQEVTVSAERLKGKEMVDRTVYSVPSAMAKSSTTGYDLLKKIPQVNVDFQNNITLNGSSNFIIQVDGKQRDREYLAKLLPSDIESIEIISNPSGKYEGNIDGVINIILKKEARYGMSGNASLSVKPFNKPTTSASGSLDYSAGKITFYITGFAFLQNLLISSQNESRFLSTDSMSRMTGSGKIKISNSSVNGGFDYYINGKNSLSLNLSYKPIGQDIHIPNQTTLFSNNVPLNTIMSATDELINSDEYSASLFYKKTFKKPIQEFTVENTFYRFSSDERNDFANTQYLYDSDTVINLTKRVENNLNRRNYVSTKVDYVQPIGMNMKIETGYQFYYQHLTYDFKIDDVVSNNLFTYNELRNSIYGGFTINHKKIGFQALVRIENSQIKADSVTDPNYSCILPSVNLQYKISASQNLKLTYNRRINRPGIYDMNPYYRIDQSYRITQGNPDLKPDYRDRLQLTFTWNFGSNYLSPYIYHELFTGKIGRLYQIVQLPGSSNFTTLTKPYNLLNGNESGGGLNAMLWFVNINARLYRGHYNSYTDGTVSIPAVDYFSYTLTSYAYAQPGKKKKTTFFAFISYNGVDRNAQSRTYNMPFYGFGGQHQYKDHSFGIFWLLPMSTNVTLSKTITQTPYYTSTNIIGFNVSNYIQFMYTYKFNKGRTVKKMNRSVEVESDSKSQAIGK